MSFRNKFMENKTFKEITTLVLKALTLAMGIAVVALSTLNFLDQQTTILLMGKGLVCDR